MSPKTLVLAGLVLVALVAIVASSEPGAFLALKQALQQKTVPGSAFGSRSTVRLLQRLGAVHLAPGDNARWAIPPVRRWKNSVGPVRGSAEPLYGTGPNAQVLPSSVLIDRSWLAKGLPTVSLAVETARLERLFSRPRARGRTWEVPGFVSYFDGGELRFQSAVGVRLHGDVSRGAWQKTYRLYFRDVYGCAEFLPGVISSSSAGPVRQLVIDRDVRLDRHKKRWYFINPIAYDIARRLGCETPATKPVMFFLNGQPQHVYVLTERIDDDFFLRHFGHENFQLIRGKGKQSRLGGIWRRELNRWARNEPQLTIAGVDRKIDLESMSRWFASVLYCGTGDAFQAAMVRDREQPAGRWFWISWDMDFSFRVPRRNPQFGWQKDLFRGTIRDAGGYRNVSRILLWRLLNESEAYRRLLAELLVEALNHRLTADFLAERLGYYEGVIEDYEIPDRQFLDELREFFNRRPGVLREQIMTYLATGASHGIRIESSADGRLEVDGHRVPAAYRGWYLEGMVVRVRVAEPYRESFSHWKIDGRVVEGGKTELDIPVSSDAVIEAVFAERAARDGRHIPRTVRGA